MEKERTLDLICMFVMLIGAICSASVTAPLPNWVPVVLFLSLALHNLANYLRFRT